MKALVIGSGGREHSLAWRLSRDGVESVVTAPGNPGSAQVGENLPVDTGDIDGLVRKVTEVAPDLVIVGPEDPLVAGLADKLRAEGISVFGPSAAAARIEGSKHWANELMYANGVPCPASETFDSLGPAVDYVRSKRPGGVVIKADGLAAGKGVAMTGTYETAISALERFLEEREFGDAGATVVIEDKIAGPELSVFGFVDGDVVSNLVAARDYKRAYLNNMGPNTGGMGAYTSRHLEWSGVLDQARESIFQPVISAMVREGCPYQGVLYAGLMLTKDGMQVIEFNCRFGDPECEPLMMRLGTNLAEVCHAVAESRLQEVDVVWDDEVYSVAVVTVSRGYPKSYKTGLPITGDFDPKWYGEIFHAGTAYDHDGNLVTAGGRVLVSTGESRYSLIDAREAAYTLACQTDFQGARMRDDIAFDAPPEFED